jgi:hypothetical protein
MKITLLSDDAIRLEPTSGPRTVEAPAAEVLEHRHDVTGAPA